MAQAIASQSLRRAASLTSAVALLSLLTACGDTGDSTSAVRTTPDATSRTSASGASEPGGRCHTSELRASLGRPDPGAGQRNYPIVLTNTAGRTCTLHGYPGAAFVDASGKQLGPDPKRSPDRATTVTLSPGGSAWAGLSYASPEISGARTATPTSLLVTPPDERQALKVAWTAGEVPVGGNESSVSVTVLQPGTGG
jgi:hypothetical protein